MKALLSQLFAALRSRPITLKMISFAMTGAGNALVDFGVFAFAYKLLELPLVPSNVLAWLMAVSGSYVMNTLITFRTESGQILRRNDYLKSEPREFWAYARQQRHSSCSLIMYRSS